MQTIRFQGIAHATLLSLCLFLLSVGGPGVAQTAEEPETKEDEIPSVSAEQVRAILETHLVTRRPGMDAVEVRSDIAYTDDGDAGPRLDLYLPAGPATSRRPVLLFVHGGPLPPGTLPEPMLRPKDWQFYRDYGRMAAAAGWIGLVPDHRYGSTAEIGRSYADLRSAVSWLKARADELGADVNRLGVWTFSGAGAHVGWAAEDLPGTVAVAGFYPVLSFDAFAALGMGDTPVDIVERYGPSALVSADSPPILIARAGRDSPPINASIDAFVAQALEAGATLDLLLHPEGVHGFDVRTDSPRSRQIVDRTFDFFADAFAGK